MNSEPKEKWHELAEQAANEQDPRKLYELIREINRLRDKRKRPPTERLRRAPPDLNLSGTT
jgi:hypothetical protein